jgi:hypothetical protein
MIEESNNDIIVEAMADIDAISSLIETSEDNAAKAKVLKEGQEAVARLHSLLREGFAAEHGYPAPQLSDLR